MTMPRLRGNLTGCITMGRRPDLLAVTLQSLAPFLADIPVLAVNDFGDDETNDAFLRHCPHGQIVNPSARMGHHRAVDLMYGAVKTDFIFHFEDDWAFDRCDFLEECEDVLRSVPMATAVCLRKTAEFVDPALSSKVQETSTKAGTRYLRLDGIHDQWYGYTFNPHIAPKATWTSVGGFAAFQKERHISRHLRAMGHIVPYLANGACHHIGEDNSVARAKPTLSQRIKAMFGL